MNFADYVCRSFLYTVYLCIDFIVMVIYDLFIYFLKITVVHLKMSFT